MGRSGTLIAIKGIISNLQGTAYGMSPYFRISYATDLESLREGCKRIQEFCADLK